MELITQRTIIRDVLRRWSSQYPDAQYGRDKLDITAQLARLDLEIATAAQVDEIIGNSSWTAVPACDECGKKRRAVIMLGQPPDYESRTACICRPCLRSALKIKRPAPGADGAGE